MPDLSFQNFYDDLGIGHAASADEVRRAYRKKALETHPDKLDPGASEEEKQKAERDFHKVHKAFEVLGDPVKRKAYDLRISARKEPQPISEDAKRRIRERREWAQRQREESVKRMAEVREQSERVKEETLAKMEKAEMLKEMLKEMYKSNPEFAMRRQAALQRKADREAMYRRTQQPIRS